MINIKKNLPLSFILVLAFGIRVFYWIDSVNIILSWDEVGHSLGGVLLAKFILSGFNWEFFYSFVAHHWTALGSLFFYPFGYDVLTTLSYLLFGFNGFASRLPAMIASILLVQATYLLAKEIFNKQLGLISSFLVAISPVVVFWGSLALLEIPLTLFITYSFFFFFRSLRTKSIKDFVLTGLFISLAAFLKPPGLIVLPFMFLVYLRRFGFRFLFSKEMWLFIATSLWTSFFYFGVGVYSYFHSSSNDPVSQMPHINIFYWFSSVWSNKEATDPVGLNLAVIVYYFRTLVWQFSDYVMVGLAVVSPFYFFKNKNNLSQFKIVYGFLFYIYFVFTFLIVNKDSRYTFMAVPMVYILTAVVIYWLYENKRLRNYLALSLLFCWVVLSMTYSLLVLKRITSASNQKNSTIEVVEYLLGLDGGKVSTDIIESTRENIWTLSYYLAIKDSDLRFEIVWPDSYSQADYLITTSDLDEVYWSKIFSKNSTYLYKKVEIDKSQ